MSLAQTFQSIRAAASTAALALFAAVSLGGCAVPVEESSEQDEAVVIVLSPPWSEKLAGVPHDPHFDAAEPALDEDLAVIEAEQPEIALDEYYQQLTDAPEVWLDQDVRVDLSQNFDAWLDSPVDDTIALDCSPGEGFVQCWTEVELLPGGEYWFEFELG